MKVARPPDLATLIITVDEMAAICGRSTRNLYDLAKAGIIPKPVSAKLPLVESLTRFIASETKTKSHRASLESLKEDKLKEEIGKLERDRKKDEKEWIEAQTWLDKIGTHIGIIRQAIKAVLLTEIPATMSGRSETEMRGMCEKVYRSLCRRIQNESENLDPRPKTQKPKEGEIL